MAGNGSVILYSSGLRKYCYAKIDWIKIEWLVVILMVEIIRFE